MDRASYGDERLQDEGLDAGCGQNDGDTREITGENRLVHLSTTTARVHNITVLQSSTIVGFRFFNSNFQSIASCERAALLSLAVDSKHVSCA